MCSSSSSSSSRRSAAEGAPLSLAHPSLLRMPLPSSSWPPGLTVGIHRMTHADRAPAMTYCSGVPSLLCYPLCVVQRELLLGELLDVQGNCKLSPAGSRAGVTSSCPQPRKRQTWDTTLLAMEFTDPREERREVSPVSSDPWREKTAEGSILATLTSG